MPDALSVVVRVKTQQSTKYVICASRTREEELQKTARCSLELRLAAIMGHCGYSCGRRTPPYGPCSMIVCLTVFELR